MKLKLISKSCYCLRLIAVLLVVVTVVTLIPKNLTAHAFESASQPDLAGIITDAADFRNLGSLHHVLDGVHFRCHGADDTDSPDFPA